MLKNDLDLLVMFREIIECYTIILMKIVITKEIKNDKNINYFNARFAFPNFLLI